MNFKNIASLLLASVISISANASLIGIVDSGTDFEHELLADKAWVNVNEIADDLVDNDRNGKVDDVNGWNFAENSGTLFVRDHLRDVNPITYKLMRLIANMQSDTLTEEDRIFWEKNVMGLNAEQRQALLTHLNFYGQYAHGTHVAGVASAQSPASKLLVGRMFPDEPVRRYQHPTLNASPLGIIDYIYGLLAKLTSGTFDFAGAYLHEMKVDVANYSLGVGLSMIARQSLALRGTKEPTDEQLSQETHRLFKQYEQKGRAWMDQASSTLFVIAAGNDGTDNDLFPIYPGSIRAENAITVAASHGNFALADFSNYGAASVDIAAPGVAIEAAVPAPDRKMLLPMSGTSMASPYVAGVAGNLKAINPSLTPAQVKKILMETVDVKNFLKGKVISSGVVNAERAAVAAELSLEMSLADAIAAAKKDVADAPVVLRNYNLKKVAAPAGLKEFARSLVF